VAEHREGAGGADRRRAEMADKIFLKCSAKQKRFDNGGSVINLGVKVADLVAFAQAHTNERGYLNLVISERREVGQYGDTHSVTLDTYVSKAKEPGGMAGPALESPPISDDDIPF
jgi:hypothetical protein